MATHDCCYRYICGYFRCSNPQVLLHVYFVIHYGCLYTVLPASLSGLVCLVCMVSCLFSHHCTCMCISLPTHLTQVACHIICWVFLIAFGCMLFVCLFVCMSVCLSVCCCLFVCWYVHVSCHPLNVCLFVCFYITSAPWSVTRSWVSPWTALSAQGVALNNMLSSVGSPLDLYTPKMQEIC